MRNYYPLPKQPTEAVPYTVHIHLRGGTGFSEDFPTYSEALAYYDTFKMGGVNDNGRVERASLRPTSLTESQHCADIEDVIAKL